MTGTGQLTSRQYRAILAAIVFGGLAVRLFHFSVALGSDDQVWVKVAQEIASGTAPTDQPVYYTRLLWTWLLVLWCRLGSFTLEWTAVLMFLLSGLTTVFIAQAARTAFDVRAALLAAVVYAVHPLAVTFDTVTLPDGLAVLLLSAGIWSFLRYLHAPHWSPLVVTGLLTGLLFGVKNYFMLTSVTCALAILRVQLAPRQRMAHVGVLAGAAATGLALMLMVGILSGIETSSHVVSAGNYASYVSQDLAAGGTQGIRQFMMMLAGRGEALAAAFSGFGAPIGLLTLSGFSFSVFRSSKAPEHLFLAGTTLLFLLFLMFMPVRLSPLTFTQFHERYLTVVLPPLAVSSGVAMAGLWEALTERGLRAAATCLFVALIGYSAWLPNGMHDRYGTLDIRAVREILATAPDHRTTILLLPGHFRRLIPDSDYERGIGFRFIDLATPAGAAVALDQIAEDPSAAIVVFRKPYRNLQEKLLTGDYSEDVAYGPYAWIMHEARARNLVVDEVRVPYDSLRVWLARAGIATRGQLVAWIIRRPAQ